MLSRKAAGPLVRRLLSSSRALPSSQPSIPLVAAEVDAATHHVSLRWSDGLRRSFHPLWLADNCLSRRHPGTRQKLKTAADLPTSLRIAAAEASDGVLQVRWDEPYQGQTTSALDQNMASHSMCSSSTTSTTHSRSSTFCANWLRAHGTDDGSQLSANDQDAALADGNEVEGQTRGSLEVRRIRFDDLAGGGAAARWAWLSAIVEDGVTILEGVPRTVGSDRVDGVRFVAELIGPMQPNIYGDIFDVISQSNAINLAYTSEGIGPHMDLCYYESPPGLQLLHCLRFDSDVDGGESLLIDAFTAAESLRESCPVAFETLCQVPATFLKDHSQRANPVLLSYQRPHLAVDPRTRRLTGVFWSPPFEGPLRGIAPDAVGAYYDAYKKLHAAIEAAPRWELRLREGEMLVFNNRRMLHGRAAFSGGADGARHLRGGYVNIDEFANAYNLLRRAHGTGRGARCDDGYRTPLGNQDWASGPIELPQAEQQAAA